MMKFILLLGAYGYLVFFLGITSLFYTPIIIVLSSIFWAVLVFWKRKMIQQWFSFVLASIRQMKGIVVLLFILLALQTIIAFLGVLTPELAFDALWYHLTLPRLYLLHHSIYHIPGGLLYYSDMPKLGEMYYVAALSLGNEITAKIVHFSFGIFTCAALFLFAKRYYSARIALLSVLILSSNLVFAWESTTAYIDLIRTLFEFMAVWSFSHWWETKRSKDILLTGIFLGFAICTKVLAIGSLGIFCLLLFGKLVTIKGYRTDTTVAEVTVYWKKLLISLCLLFIPALLFPLPWFLFAFHNTGNPFYPFFSPVYPINPSTPSLISFVHDIWILFTQASDPISPLYLIMAPLVLITFSNLRPVVKMIVWYCGLSILLWYLTPQTGGGRFILPYLPAFSFIVGAVYSVLLKEARIAIFDALAKIVFSIIIVIALMTIGYRAAATARYLPVVLGQETKARFLTDHLNYAFGDFYDTDNYFATHIKPDDSVLLYGFHNLYYVDFPFVDSSWVQKGDKFTYIAIQNGSLPERFYDWELVYTNNKTLVKLYKPPSGQCKKVCVY
jgi:Dolichyl-phosphate-mannose-protein mannosyltransferase